MVAMEMVGETGTARASEVREAHRPWPLHLRFAAAGSIVVIIGMLVTGWWVSREIEESVTRNSALSTAVYMESFIAPLSQELSTQDEISPETAAKLRKLFAEPTLAERIVSVKIWKPGGLIAYSNDPNLIGKRFEPGPPLVAAWQGMLSAAFDDLHDEEDYLESTLNEPLLEVYNPIHSIITGEIIAVAEFYQVATELEQDLFKARLTSFLVVAGVFAAMFALLFGIVRQGSRTIERQTFEIESRFAELQRMSEQNTALRKRIQAASMRAGEHNERFLRRISAELHDGPAQALAVAALRLDGLFRDAGKGAENRDLNTVRESLDAAMREIRGICRGLSLPEIERRSLAEVLELAAETHAQRTGAEVALELEHASLDTLPLDRSQLICVFRFVQEGLNNAFRHGGGVDQRVACWIENDMLNVRVSDAGPGFDPDSLTGDPTRLGLAGLRERVESTGGHFSIVSDVKIGTRLTMSLPLGD